MELSFQIIDLCQNKIKSLKSMISISFYEKRLDEIAELMGSPNFWLDSKKAISLSKEHQQASTLLLNLKRFEEEVYFYTELSKSYPQDISQEFDKINLLYKEISEFELQQMMSDPVDNTSAILTISAGAGGLESASWVTMLLRMYCRYADCYKFNVELLDKKSSEEHSAICTDTATIRVDGPYAYGFFKGESGVHRLVRQSPFSAADARHTSFAAVAVSPDIEDIIDIKIEDKDIDVSAQRGSGAGGQHRNVTNSAIRLRHLPTGINILVQTERDFHANKRTAFKMLKAKLYDLEVKKRKEISDGQIDNLSDVSFGYQARSYVETPHSLVTDHRTDLKINNFDKVLDGEIHEFLLAYLRWNAHK
jgi:peptide chain release factor 2